MRKLAVLVIAAILATAFTSVDASAKTHHKHAANHAKAAPTEPVEKPQTRLPVPPDAFRA
jgi:hypothetical protein